MRFNPNYKIRCKWCRKPFEGIEACDLENRFFCDDNCVRNYALQELGLFPQE